MPISDSSALATVFSPAVVKALASARVGAAASRISRLIEHGASPSTPLGDAFERAHARLLSEYRSEYAFKNQIVSKIVLGRHSVATASAIIEQHAGKSVADVLVLNGTSAIYEVKTDLDSFARLPTQIEDYRRRAEFVYVVVSEHKANIAERHAPQDVGVLALSRRGSFSLVRPPASNLRRLNHYDLFQMLRTGEAASIARRGLGRALQVPNGDLRDVSYEYFQSLPLQQAHAVMVRELKGRALSARRLLACAKFPASLRALAYATELSKIGATRLQGRLALPAIDILSAASRWSK